VKLQQKTILVTGASSGIGRAVAVLLGQQANRLIVTARRKELLDSLAQEITDAGGQCLAIEADALNAEEAAAVVRQAVAKFGTIDAALLNIGDGPPFNMAEEEAVAVTDNMRLNYDTLVHYLTPLIAQMKTQNHGLIAHTNSLAGFLGLPQQGPYSAAKAACRILMDTCRVELANHNIRFVSVYPGFVATDRVAADGIPAPLEISEQAAAKHIIYAMEKEKRDYLFPPSMRWLIRLARVLPKPIVGFFTSRMMDTE
jgi:NADP-dependent 3-hydroxy acid dehydrogenase YdfG